MNEDHHLSEHAWFNNMAEVCPSVSMEVTSLWRATMRDDLTFESVERYRVQLGRVRTAGFTMRISEFFGALSVVFSEGKGGR